MRKPTRSLLWSSMLEMPASFPSRTCSAIEVMKLSWLTWYGSSVITSEGRARQSSLRSQHAAHADRPAAGGVGGVDALRSDDQTVGGEVRTLDPLADRSQGGLFVGLVIVQAPVDGLGQLAQAVRRDGGRHSDRHTA